MGGGQYSFEIIPELVDAGKINQDTVDRAVARVLRTKFVMGLFENPYRAVPDDEFFDHINTEDHRKLAREIDAESIVLLENHEGILPISKDAHVAVIGPMAHGYVNVSIATVPLNLSLGSMQADLTKYGDYVIHTSMTRGVTPYEGIRGASDGTVTFSQGGERWSNDEEGFPEAIEAAEAADVAVVVVGTWSRDQDELWAGLNATTGKRTNNPFKLRCHWQFDATH